MPIKLTEHRRHRYQHYSAPIYAPPIPTQSGAGATTRLWSGLWKSVKHEEVYLHAYDSVCAARTSLSRHFRFYNIRRLHITLTSARPMSCTSNRCRPRRQLETAGSHLTTRVLLFKLAGPLLNAMVREFTISSNQGSKRED